MNEDQKLALILSSQREVEKQLEQISVRLEQVGKIAIITEQSLDHLKGSLDEEKTRTKENFKTVHSSIHRRDNHVKWLFVSVMMPIVLSIVAFFKTSLS